MIGGTAIVGRLANSGSRVRVLVYVSARVGNTFRPYFT